MLTRNDLDEAVRGGIITATQAENLLALPARRHEARQAQTLRDERFVFMRSFNEFFIALGVVLLGVGLWTASGEGTPFAKWVPWVSPVIIWGLAEFLTAKKRYTLPSIVLAAMFTSFIILLFPELFPGLNAVPDPEKGLMASVAILLASIAFYWRFRLPFSLLLIVASAIPLIVLIVNRVLGVPDQGVFNIILLVIGVIAFAVALRFDMSDRERLTRRADCAFWLMLAAAPLIVHPVITLLTTVKLTEIWANFFTLCAVAVFALIALIVDRRAFLVSSLAYLGATIVAGIGAIAGEGNALWATLVVMGAAVVLLGVGWQSARAFVMRPLPQSFASHFPVIRVS